MTIAEFTLTLFTISNSVRILAYVPQIFRAATDPSGAQAVSCATWGLFLLSNVSAAAYSIVNNEDWMMAAMFFGNSAGCSAILLVAALRRSQHRNRVTQLKALECQCPAL